jgi:hypothetical protein
MSLPGLTRPYRRRSTPAPALCAESSMNPAHKASAQQQAREAEETQRRLREEFYERDARRRAA